MAHHCLVPPWYPTAPEDTGVHFSILILLRVPASGHPQHQLLPPSPQECGSG